MIKPQVINTAAFTGQSIIRLMFKAAGFEERYSDILPLVETLATLKVP